MGEAQRKALVSEKGMIALDTFGGRIHVEWDPAAAVTPLGQLPFFIEFLKVSGLFDVWVVIRVGAGFAPGRGGLSACVPKQQWIGQARGACDLPAVDFSRPPALRAHQRDSPGRHSPGTLEVWRNWFQKMRRAVRLRAWTNPPARRGWTGTWRKQHSPCCPRRGSWI